jgi:hypothetical protein
MFYCHPDDVEEYDFYGDMYSHYNRNFRATYTFSTLTSAENKAKPYLANGLCVLIVGSPVHTETDSVAGYDYDILAVGNRCFIESECKRLGLEDWDDCDIRILGGE